MTLFGLDVGMSDTRDPVIISTLEFDVLWEHLGLETMPLVLKVPSPPLPKSPPRPVPSPAPPPPPFPPGPPGAVAVPPLPPVPLAATACQE